MALTGRHAAYDEYTAGHAGLNGTGTVVRVDLITGEETRIVINPYGHFPAQYVQRLRLTDSGVVVIAEGVGRRTRIRRLTGTEARLLDAGPGIDPDSLAVQGDTVTWTRDGVRQTA